MPMMNCFTKSKSGSVSSPSVPLLITSTEYPKTINETIKVTMLKMMVKVSFLTPYDGRIVDKLINIIKAQNIKNFRVSLIGYLMASVIISRKFNFVQIKLRA